MVGFLFHKFYKFSEFSVLVLNQLLWSLMCSGDYYPVSQKTGHSTVADNIAKC